MTGPTKTRKMSSINLKTGDGYYNYHKRTLGDFFDDIASGGLTATLRNRSAWGNMRMDPRDITDVSGAQTGGTYTYLINGHPPAANWTGLFKPGEKVRLRFINSSAMSYFDVRIPGLKMTVVAADGSNVEPVSVDEFRIAVAETYDVIVTPREDAYTIFAQAMDRSGYARATLAVRQGLTAPVPPMDPVFSRTMADMGMAGMNMGGMKDMDAAPDRSSMKGMQGMSAMGDIGHGHGKQEAMRRRCRAWRIRRQPMPPARLPIRSRRTCIWNWGRRSSTSSPTQPNG